MILYRFFIYFIVVCFSGALAYLGELSTLNEFLKQKYEINLAVLGFILIFSEIFYLVGIYWMVRNYRITNSVWRDIVRFNFIEFEKRAELSQYRAGLFINRLAAIAPWAYLLVGGQNFVWWVKPVLVILIILLIPNVQKYVHKKIRYFRKLINLYFKLKRKILPDGFYIHSPQNVKEEEEMYKLRYKVYCEEFNYLNPNNYPNKIEKDEYDPHSVHFVIVCNNPHDKVVGTIRIIRNSEASFPLEKNFKLNIDPYKLQRKNIIEVSRLIVKREFRIDNFMLDLIRELYQYAKRFNISHVYAVMDERLYNTFKNIGFPFKKIGETKNYQGITTPYLLQVKELEKNLYFRNHRKMFNYLMEGLETKYRPLVGVYK